MVLTYCASYYTTKAATNLPTSNALPIAMIGTTAPANKVDKPTIE